MKQIGAEIGVNESRVSQLHARAIRRLREALTGVMPRPRQRRPWCGIFQQKPRMAKAGLDSQVRSATTSTHGVVVSYPVQRAARARALGKSGLGVGSQSMTARKRQPAASTASTLPKVARRGTPVAIAR